jgi:hypothetical protein
LQTYGFMDFQPHLASKPAMTLTEPQQIAVIHASRPLEPNERTAFLTELTAQLAGHHEIGDGQLAHSLRALQHKHFKPPVKTAWD